MFNNIGRKIKTVAAIATWICIIIFVIIGLVCIAQEMVGIGFLIMLIGSLVSWLSSFLLYGFGQLIENTDVLAGRYELSASKPTAQTEEVGSVDDDVLAFLVQQYNDGEINEKEYMESLEEIRSFIEHQYKEGEIDEKTYNKKIKMFDNL